MACIQRVEDAPPVAPYESAFETLKPGLRITTLFLDRTGALTVTVCAISTELGRGSGIYPHKFTPAQFVLCSITLGCEQCKGEKRHRLGGGHRSSRWRGRATWLCVSGDLLWRRRGAVRRRGRARDIGGAPGCAGACRGAVDERVPMVVHMRERECGRRNACLTLLVEYAKTETRVGEVATDSTLNVCEAGEGEGV